MTYRLTRRITFLLPFLLGSCGDDEGPAAPIRRDFPPLRYGYLPPINVNVQRLETTGDFVPPTGDDEVADPSTAETLYAMARDRLKPVGNSGTATFRVVTASTIRHHDTLNGTLVVRLDISDAGGLNAGFAEARATANHTGPMPDVRAAAYDLLKTMMDSMNVELEYQLRNKLRPWIVDVPTEAVPQPVDPSVKLPPPPPAPPNSPDRP